MVLFFKPFPNKFDGSIITQIDNHLLGLSPNGFRLLALQPCIEP